ncbi:MULTISPECIES: HpcH/HpaI aldolase/citrate lyase family protein [Halorussus]|uniref:HpcH/HpaI aldolase family protein n=1 Tax=Halorussus TaxID=1070314 RepID=UPI000E212303|nr:MULTISPECIES: aldolase/citrate lyase family protein [Halorussus]NHN57929.1 aldolase [Halorussus sp. JP-T4]
MASDNTIRRKWDEGEPVIGAKAMTMSPAVVEVYGALGFDFAWLDFEQLGGSPLDSTAVDELTRAADAAGIEPLVRLPAPDPTTARKLLAAGVRTVLVPHVETAAQLREVVSATRFTYDGAPGGRGATTGRANAWGAGARPADEDIVVGTMVETKAALEEIDELLSVPELGFAFVGPADLSVALGHPVEKDHPEVREAVATVRDACLAADVPVGCAADDRATAESALEEEYRLVRVGDELSAAREVLGERVEHLRAAAVEPSE